MNWGINLWTSTSRRCSTREIRKMIDELKVQSAFRNHLFYCGGGKAQRAWKQALYQLSSFRKHLESMDQLIHVEVESRSKVVESFALKVQTHHSRYTLTLLLWENEQGEVGFRFEGGSFPHLTTKTLTYKKSRICSKYFFGSHPKKYE